MDFSKFRLIGLNKDILQVITSWEYEKPYDIYDLRQNEYIKDSSTWGKEQYVLEKK